MTGESATGVAVAVAVGPEATGVDGSESSPPAPPLVHATNSIVVANIDANAAPTRFVVVPMPRRYRAEEARAVSIAQRSYPIAAGRGTTASRSRHDEARSRLRPSTGPTVLSTVDRPCSPDARHHSSRGNHVHITPPRRRHRPARRRLGRGPRPHARHGLRRRGRPRVDRRPDRHLDADRLDVGRLDERHRRDRPGRGRTGGARAGRTRRPGRRPRDARERRHRHQRIVGGNDPRGLTGGRRPGRDPGLDPGGRSGRSRGRRGRRRPLRPHPRHRRAPGPGLPGRRPGLHTR
ncbi:hypothetical protein FRIGORI9N_520006 [Frigoribacterium sp. 9N]|nr:hypothetical protein FRIGORI9N_520006 [Frigoribacterium sp. 9N]